MFAETGGGHLPLGLHDERLLYVRDAVENHRFISINHKFLYPRASCLCATLCMGDRRGDTCAIEVSKADKVPVLAKHMHIRCSYMVSSFTNSI